jgi:hypothetical protein
MAIATLFGCSKKNTPTPSPTPIINLVGKWKTTADTLYIYQNSVLTKTYVFTGNPIQLADYQFNQDGSVLYTGQSDPSNPATANYSLKGSVITFNHPTQVIDGNTQQGYTQNATVKSFANGKMEIVYDDSSTGNGVTERDLEVEYMTKQN